MSQESKMIYYKLILSMSDGTIVKLGSLGKTLFEAHEEGRKMLGRKFGQEQREVTAFGVSPIITREG